jgi:predicted DNA-binding transcriptional regulator AlpA
MEKIKYSSPQNIPFLSFEETVKALDCSRSFVYSLIEQGILTPKYIKTKPYFIIEDIMKAMKERAY